MPDFKDAHFVDDSTTVPDESVEVEFDEPNNGMVRYMDEDPNVRAAKQMMDHASAKLQLKWEQEKLDREKWKADDLRVQTRYKIAAMVAGSMIGEGAMGNRQRADQIAKQAVEIADAVLVQLEKHPIPSFAGRKE